MTVKMMTQKLFIVRQQLVADRLLNVIDDSLLDCMALISTAKVVYWYVQLI